MGFFDRFRSEKPKAEQPSKATSKKQEGAQELVPYAELLEGVHDELKKVSASLAEERAIAKEIRGLGFSLSKEAAASIRGLEKRYKELMNVFNATLSPVAKEAAIAQIGGEQLLVLKPADFDKLMVGPDDLGDANLVEAQTSVEMKAKEAQLKAEADSIEDEMMGVIDQINELSDRADFLPTGVSEDIKKQQVSVLRSRFVDLQKELGQIRQSLTGVQLDLGMAKRMEGKDTAQAA